METILPENIGFDLHDHFLSSWSLNCALMKSLITCQVCGSSSPTFGHQFNLYSYCCNSIHGGFLRSFSSLSKVPTITTMPVAVALTNYELFM